MKITNFIDTKYKDQKDVYYCDYPTEPIESGNPYYRCVYCKRSDPEINGRLEGHEKTCGWVMNKLK